MFVRVERFDDAQGLSVECGVPLLCGGESGGIKGEGVALLKNGSARGYVRGMCVHMKGCAWGWCLQ